MEGCAAWPNGVEAAADGCAGWPNAGAPKGLGFWPSAEACPKAEPAVCACLPKGEDVPPSWVGCPNALVGWVAWPKAGVPKGLGFCPSADGWPKAPPAAGVADELPKGLADAAGTPNGDDVLGLPTAKEPFVPPG